MSNERRSFQRLFLTRAIDAWFGDFAVRLIDVSATGAQLESDETIPADARALLRFFWKGKEVEMMSEVVRNTNDRWAVHFLDTSDVLNELIAESAEEILRAQIANAEGNRAANRVGDETLTAASAGLSSGGPAYVIWRFDGTTWKKRPSMLSDQPEDGFTVATSLQPEQVDMLCRTYESGDAEARRLTRLLAELSVARAH